MIFHRILLSDVIHFSYQLFWYFAWNGCQSRHLVVSWIMMSPFSEDCHKAAVFQSFGFPQCSEIHYNLMSAVIKSIWHKKVNDHVPHLPFPSNSVPFSPSSRPPEGPQTCKPPLLLLEGWKVAALCSSSSPLKQGDSMWGLSSVKERKRKRKRKNHNCSKQLSAVLPTSSCFSFTHGVGGLVGEGAPDLLQRWRWAVLSQWWRAALRDDQKRARSRQNHEYVLFSSF